MQCLQCQKQTVNHRRFCNRFCWGAFYIRGRKLSSEHKKKLATSKMGDKNPMWRGNKVGYTSLHQWIKDHKTKNVFCEECKIKPPKDLADVMLNNLKQFQDNRRVL